jgi:hypothetical protein
MSCEVSVILVHIEQHTQRTRWRAGIARAIVEEILARGFG